MNFSELKNALQTSGLTESFINNSQILTDQQAQSCTFCTSCIACSTSCAICTYALASI